ncbi:hypothetical protein [Nonomuraea sp. NPDC003201]
MSSLSSGRRLLTRSVGWDSRNDLRRSAESVSLATPYSHATSLPRTGR